MKIRRLIKLFLFFSACILLVLPLNSCQKLTGGGACEKFIEYLRAGAYEEAYALLSSSSRNDEEKERANRIQKQEFVDKHTAIYDALEIDSFNISNIRKNEGEIITTMDYTLTFQSGIIGQMKYDYSMVARREDGSWRIEWSPALIFPMMEWGDTVRFGSIAAKRGEILADGCALAQTVDAMSVYASVSELDEADVSRLAGLLGMETDEVQKKLNKAYDDIAIIHELYPDEMPNSLREQLLGIKGVGIDEGNYAKLRDYPYKDTLAHFVGYVGNATKEEAEALNAELDDGNALYTTDSIIGKLGLEKLYEKELRGVDGYRIFVRTEEGTNRHTLFMQPAQDGLDVQLTINMDLQLRLNELMDLVLYGDDTAGAVVVMNPVTGDIEAMTSYPSYDLNLFARGMSNEAYQALKDAGNTPLYNRVTQGRYPPGSVFKAFTAAMALEYGVLDPDEVFTGTIKDDLWFPTGYGSWIWPGIRRNRMRNRAEPLNMHNAIVNSDNIYFADAALKIGKERFIDYCAKLGLGEAVSFELGAAKSQLMNEGTDWHYKFLADSGYGQGEMLITPLQLAATFSAFANGGDAPEPHLVHSLFKTDGRDYSAVWTREISVWKEGVIEESSIRTLTPMLEHVTSPDYNGTGRPLKVNSCTVAAKTGTAEIGSDKSREISWFVGYRTGVEPEQERLVMVMLEVPAKDEYGELKFEIARHLLKLSAP